jgi:hypothetical protein
LGCKNACGSWTHAAGPEKIVEKIGLSLYFSAINRFVIKLESPQPGEKQ